ncbi:MAG TPA: ABC transporter permease subunit [Microbacteriaceae bacterium]|nr:ABC transporter permease subunit [Microbacteriaceae bacterium]
MRRALPWIWGAIGIVAVVAIWELYKWLGPADGVVLGAIQGQAGSGFRILPRTGDLNMPHIWDMFTRLGESNGPGTPALWVSVLSGLGMTLAMSAVGLLIGLVVGVALALAMQRWRIVEWGVLPWVIVSQTVPLIAFAPIIARMGTQIDKTGFPWPGWLSVALIASYLAFFPIAVGALRGLASPDPIHVDLLRSYGAGYGKTLVKLRLPASVLYLLPALRLGATSAVVGAIVAEVSIGMPGGLGRMIIQLAQSASADPALPYGPIIGAVLVGLIAAGSVALLGVILKNYRRGEAVA